MANATQVSPGGSMTQGVLTDLGSFDAGTYSLIGSGSVDLTGEGMVINPNGVPASPVPAPYDYFNPGGSYVADGKYGGAGANAKIGALIGTFNATPTSANDWFLIGYGTTVTLATAGHIYASVNDTYHDNNRGAFSVTVTSVPEPQVGLLMAAGLLVLGVGRRKAWRQ